MRPSTNLQLINDELIVIQLEKAHTSVWRTNNFTQRTINETGETC